MLNGLLRALLAAAQYLHAQIAVSGESAQADESDLNAIGFDYLLPATLGELLSFIEEEITKVQLKLEELIGKDCYNAIVKEYDETLTQYLSKKSQKNFNR